MPTRNAVVMASADATAVAGSDVLPAFVDTVEELLSGLREVFPECPNVNKKWLKFRAFVKSADEVDDEGRVTQKGQLKPEGAKVLIKDWHRQMSPHYDACRRRDVARLLELELPILQELDMRTKWQDPSFDQESRDTLFQYLDALNMYAQMQFVPTGMLNRIQGVAKMLAQEYSNGEFDMAKVDLMSIGQRVMEGTSEEELLSMAGNLGELQRMIRDQAGQMGSDAPPELQNLAQSLLGATAGGGAADAAGGGGGLDMRALMNMMGSMVKPPQ